MPHFKKMTKDSPVGKGTRDVGLGDVVSEHFLSLEAGQVLVMETSLHGSQSLSHLRWPGDTVITFSREFCGSVILRNHFFSGVWVLRQVELAENLRGETQALFIKGEVVSFPVYRNATGCLPALFPWWWGGRWSSLLHRHQSLFL